MRKSYVALAYLLVFCLISSSVSFADTIPNATGAAASDVHSEHVMTTAKLGKKDSLDLSCLKTAWLSIQQKTMRTEKSFS